MSSTTEADYTADNQGSIFLFRPLTEAARLHLEEHCSDTTWFGDAVVYEHRSGEKVSYLNESKPQ